jgi:hypothetical protein
LGIGTSAPIGAGGDRAQPRDRKASSGIGREGAICECDEIMQILPGSSDKALLIDSSRMICKTAAARDRHRA